MGLSLERRLLRLVREQDQAIAQLATQQPDSRGAEYLRDRIARLDSLMQRVRLNPVSPPRLRPATAPRAAVVAAPIAPAPRSVPPIGFGGIPMPPNAEAFRLPREQDLELVTVWRPHRDAPSLIGSYESRPR
jgi:hypothetical protein